MLCIGTLDTMLRSLVIGLLGRYGDPDMITEAKCRFDNHITEKDSIPADIRTAVFSAVLSNGDETTFDKLVEVRSNTSLFQFVNPMLCV